MRSCCSAPNVLDGHVPVAWKFHASFDGGHVTWPKAVQFIPSQMHKCWQRLRTVGIVGSSSTHWLEKRSTSCKLLRTDVFPEASSMAIPHGAPFNLAYARKLASLESEPGSVHADISHEKGMGEETMMAFIHKHLNSILQPFADSVSVLPHTVA